MLPAAAQVPVHPDEFFEPAMPPRSHPNFEEKSSIITEAADGTPCSTRREIEGARAF